jgi:hypothetical protein
LASSSDLWPAIHLSSASSSGKTSIGIPSPGNRAFPLPLLAGADVFRVTDPARLGALTGTGSTGGMDSPLARAATIAGTGGDGGACRIGLLDDSASEVGGVCDVRGCCASAEGGLDVD